MNTEADKLANEIMDLSRDKLIVNMRFMDVALSYHKRKAYDGTFATNGRTLMYNTEFILCKYKESQEETVRMYLHVILHCVFQHPFVGIGINNRLWNLACDMAVECTINDLGLNSASSCRTSKQNQIISGLKKNLKFLTAEKIYALFVKANYPEWAIEQWEEAFRTDDHSFWYVWLATISGQTGETENGDKNVYSVSGMLSDREFWESVSNQIQMDMEVFSKKWGDEGGNLMQNLRFVNREKYNYTAFLKKFAVLGEAMKINEDEFDYIYYTYGLEHYDNMPLIEPLEYKEVKRIKEFVIVIDTSGSVMGEEVQMFIQKTYNILMQEDSYFSKVNIHIIQCDAKIQEDVVIRNKNDFEAYIKEMKIKGLGGTDFRPAFRYVDNLIADNQLTNLKGLIYFTDGYGTFPDHKPSYTSAFVFVEDGYTSPAVPPWAIKLVLYHEDLLIKNIAEV